MEIRIRSGLDSADRRARGTGFAPAGGKGRARGAERFFGPSELRLLIPRLEGEPRGLPRPPTQVDRGLEPPVREAPADGLLKHELLAVPGIDGGPGAGGGGEGVS